MTSNPTRNEKGQFAKGNTINVGENNPRFGVKVSDFTKERQRITRNKHYPNGFKHSEDSKKRMSERLKGKSSYWKGKKREPFSKEHLEKLSKSHTGKINEKASNWKGGVTPFYRVLRIARLKLAGGLHTVFEWETLKAQYNWTCPNCKKEEPSIKLTIDHIIPVSKGGSDNIENIQPLCSSCNSKKYNKIIKYEYQLVEK